MKLKKQTAATTLERSDQSVRPVNHQIAALLRQRILAGEYTKDEGLPPELLLAEEFQVSRHTIRAALQKLVVDGLIERRRGIGTAVVPREALANTWAVDSIEAIVGEFYTADLIFASPVPAENYPEMAKLFRLGKGESIFRLVRLLKSKVGPYAYSTVFTRAEYAARVPKKLMGKTTFISLIEKHCGVKVANVRQSSAAVSGPPAATDALGVPDGHPLLQQRRQFFSRSGDAISHAEMFCRSDRYMPVVVFAREDKSSPEKSA